MVNLIKENGVQRCQIDLILPTINKFLPSDNIFDSLKRQTFTDFRLIIVHQGRYDFDFNLLDGLNYKYMLINEFGLSKGRNLALAQVEAPYISFIDDDALLPKQYFENVYKLLILGISAVCGIIVDPISRRPISRAMKKCEGFFLTKSDFLYCVSSALSLSSEKVPKFNEQLGLGAAFGSGEEGEYFFKLIDNRKVKFDPSLVVLHKNDLEKVKTMNFVTAFNRGLSYGKGHGAVYKIGMLRYKSLFFIYLFLKSLFFSTGSAFVYLLKLELKCAMRDVGRIIGKIIGFFVYST